MSCHDLRTSPTALNVTMRPETGRLMVNLSLHAWAHQLIMLLFAIVVDLYNNWCIIVHFICQVTQASRADTCYHGNTERCWNHRFTVTQLCVIQYTTKHKCAWKPANEQKCKSNQSAMPPYTAGRLRIVLRYQLYQVLTRMLSHGTWLINSIVFIMVATQFNHLLARFHGYTCDCAWRTRDSSKRNFSNTALVAWFWFSHEGAAGQQRAASWMLRCRFPWPRSYVMWCFVGKSRGSHVTVQHWPAESSDSTKLLGGKWAYRTEAGQHANSRAKVII